MSNTHTISLVVALAALGCSKPSGPLGKKPPDLVDITATIGSEQATTRPRQSVLERLEQMSEKGPVIFVASNKGLAAVQGDEVEILVPGTSVNARGSYNRPADLFWYLDGQVLSVLDLRQQKPKPVRILEGLPPISQVAIMWFYENIGYGADFDGPSGQSGYRELDVHFSDDEVRLRPGRDVDINATKIVGLPWLKAQASRPGKPIRRATWPKVVTKLPEDVESFRECFNLDGEDDECVGVAFGTSHWVLFQALKDCSHGYCRLACRLSDGNSNNVAMPAAQPVWLETLDAPDLVAEAPHAALSTCGPYFFNFAGSSYYTSARMEVCTVGRGCKPVDGKVLDFFEHGPAVSLGNDRWNIRGL